jgi:hypothetical protein
MLATIGTVLFCILGAASVILVWAIAEMDGASEAGCMAILAGFCGILVAIGGLYACGTLGAVLKVVM